MQCTFCDLGAGPAGRNLTADEMREQLLVILKESSARGVDIDHGLKANFAKTGEPLFNPHLAQTIHRMAREIDGIRFKVSSVVPSARAAQKNFDILAQEAGQCPTSIQMQISLISSSEEYRRKHAGRVASFQAISDMAARWREAQPRRAQFNLSMILSDDTPCDPDELLPHFDPRFFRIRLRDCIQTAAAKSGGLRMIENHALFAARDRLESAGYTVSLAGRPTTTERSNALAANATRNTIRLHAE